MSFLPERSFSPYIAAFMVLMLVFSAGKTYSQQALIEKLIGKETKKEGDTTEKKPKKPLESYFFDDSTRKVKVLVWRANLDRNSIVLDKVDTTLNRFEVDYPFMVQDIGSAYLGNLGGAVVPLNYFDRRDYADFSFMEAYDAYLKDPSRARFYNVKVPFTNMSWYMSGQTRNAEEQLRVAHAQNISPSSGFNLEYLNRGTKGMYSSQKAKDKNLSIAFSHTGKRYSIHTGYIYNGGNIRENGGIQNDYDITDTIYNPTYNIPVNLTDATNLFKGNTFYATQAYGIPLQRVSEADFSIADKSSIFIGHAFEYTTYFKKYTDTKAKSGNFYEHWYINPSASSDSIHESKLDNKLFLQIQPWDRNSILGTLDAGVGYAFHRYYNFNMDQYISGYQPVKRDDLYIYGSLSGKFRKYAAWEASLKYHPLGDLSQDMMISGKLSASAYIKSRPITLSLSGYIDNRTPSYWDENYFSNHFVWSVNFDKEMETRLEAKVEVPSANFEAGISNSVITDKIYYDNSAMPAQYNGTLAITAIYGRKDFKLGIVNLNHRALIQKSSNESVVALPLVSAYIDYFIDFQLVRNVLRTQLGIDGWYNTEYYAPAYNPATMTFCNQNEKKLGNYPFMDAYLSAKWKRMRILVKFQHVNENMFGERNYFTVLHYPLNKRMFKLGFSWSFYD